MKLWKSKNSKITSDSIYDETMQDTLDNIVSQVNQKENLVNSITFSKWFTTCVGITDNTNLILTLNSPKEFKSGNLKIVNDIFALRVNGTDYSINKAGCSIYRLDNGSLYMTVPRSQLSGLGANLYNVFCTIRSDLTISLA